MDISPEALERFQRSNDRARKAVLVSMLVGFPLGGAIGCIVALCVDGPIDRIGAGGALVGFLTFLWAGFAWASIGDR